MRLCHVEIPRERMGRPKDREDHRVIVAERGSVLCQAQALVAIMAWSVGPTIHGALPVAPCEQRQSEGIVSVMGKRVSEKRAGRFVLVLVKRPDQRKRSQHEVVCVQTFGPFA